MHNIQRVYDIFGPGSKADKVAPRKIKASSVSKKKMLPVYVHHMTSKAIIISRWPLK